MTTPTLEEMLELTIELTKEMSNTIVESGEEHQPIMLILTPDGITASPLVQLDKSIFKQVMGELLRQLRAYAYVLIFEAWETQLAKGSHILPRLLGGEIAVSELPLDDRAEVLTITVVENGKSLRQLFAKIQYTRDDRRFLGEWVERDGSFRVMGRMVLKEW